jgi:hypothetical protein
MPSLKLSPAWVRGFSFDQLGATSTGAYTWSLDSHEKWKEKTLVDICTGSRAKVACKKENAGGENS